MSDMRVSYRGSLKHKNRPARGRKGTICPDWTHGIGSGGIVGDPAHHNWGATEAHRLFEDSEPDPGGSEKRYATDRGIAFVAQPTRDGTWHGYPEPWNRVPAELKDQWLAEGRVTARQLKRYKEFPHGNVSWALVTDDD